MLVVLVLWLRQSDSNLLGSSLSEPRKISVAERIETLDAESNRLLAENRASEARQLWLNFRKLHPEVQPARVAAEIQELEGRLPLTESRILAERRYQEAFNALNDQNLAVAFAYLKSAISLSPDLAKSAVTSTTLQNLERKLTMLPSPADVEEADQVLQAGLSRVQSGQLDAETQKLLVRAVETDYTSSETWEALGDFYLKSQNVDSARVMYGEAAALAIAADQQARLNTKLAKIST